MRKLCSEGRVFVSHPAEIEVKLSASSAMLEALQKHRHLLGENHQSTLVATYFDTRDARLQRAGAALRIRGDGTHCEQTLKLASSHGTIVRRQEWNAPVQGALPQPTGFPAKARSALIRLLQDEPLAPVGTTRIDRTTRRLQYGGSVIEIAFDTGSIEAGARVEPVCELELELVAGNLADMIALALTLPLGADLRWSVRSKAERCHALAYDLPVAAAHARPVKLVPSMDAAQGLQAIAWNCLEQLLANYPLVIASGDLEALHQARVAIRRLRAAGSLFAEIARDKAAPVLLAEWKAVAAALGPARDLHVLVERVAASAQGRDDDVREMLAHLSAQRDRAVASAQALLAAEPFQRLLFQQAAWIEAGEWLERKKETGGVRPVLSFAAHILSRRQRKLRRVADQLADLSADERHRLRIQVKKLRYAATFFAALFPDKSAAKYQAVFARGLERLQDSLGELHDMAVAKAARDKLFADLDVITAARLAGQLDSLLAADAHSQRKLLRQSEKALAKVVNSARWWQAN